MQIAADRRQGWECRADRQPSRTVTLFGSQTLRQKSLNIMMQQSDMLHY